MKSLLKRFYPLLTSNSLLIRNWLRDDFAKCFLVAWRVLIKYSIETEFCHIVNDALLLNTISLS